MEPFVIIDKLIDVQSQASSTKQFNCGFNKKKSLPLTKAQIYFQDLEPLYM
uniref:Uncharacterized protein n=1 Tax=Nelumbo nucifera TaxID=4432 RepID=A0A822XTB5_NELNU|nr:TPA_asm: hypothetical protein HUJ06_022151 [Nelumbo nucifera]